MHEAPSLIKPPGGQVRLRNRWRNDHFIHIEHEALEVGAIEPGWRSAHWSLRPVENSPFVVICNGLHTDHYLQMRDSGLTCGLLLDRVPVAQASFSTGSRSHLLSPAPASQGAHWYIERIKGTAFVRFRNRWRHECYINCDGKIEGDEHLFVDLFEVPPDVPKVVGGGDAPSQIAPIIVTGTGNIIDDDIELLVNVVFQGGGGGPVDILLECNGNGTIDDDTKTTVGGSATFEVINYVDPLDCTAVPTSTPSGTYLTSSDCNPGMDEADTECVMVFAPTRTTFTVTKEFTDGDNPTEVEVTINCFTGLPIEQSQEINENQGVEFIVTDFDSGELDCEITEEDLFGYTPTYNPGGPGSYDADGGCNFQDVEGGAENTCHIVNDADPVDVVIEKLWVIEGVGGDQIDTSYKLTLYCDAQIADASYCHGASGTVDSPEGNGNSWTCKKNFYGDDSQVFTAHVTPEYPSSHCWVDESVYDNAVEIDNDCGNLVISAGNGDSCVITNTVFFEGQ